MKLFSKVLTGVAVAAAMAMSTQASAITVQGINFDPGPVLGQFNFRQQFLPSPPAVGSVLNGLGEFYYFGKTNLTDPIVNANSLTGGAAGTFAPGRELTFEFGGFTVIPGFQFSGGFLKVYSDNSNDYVGGSTNFGQANNSDFSIPFLELTAVSSEFTTSSGAIGFQSGILDVVWNVTGGAAKAFFDTNSFGTGFDVTSRASAIFGSGQFSNTGANGQVNTVATVPEPESLALVGLGLLGLAISRRRKSV